VMVLMGQGIANAFPQDQRANDTRAAAHARVRDYSSFRCSCNISAGYPGTKEWVQQVQLALPPADDLRLHRGERARVLPVPPVRASCAGCSAAWPGPPSTRSCAARRVRHARHGRAVAGARVRGAVHRAGERRAVDASGGPSA
jgi:hypothetical protein